MLQNILQKPIKVGEWGIAKGVRSSAPLSYLTFVQIAVLVKMGSLLPLAARGTDVYLEAKL